MREQAMNEAYKAGRHCTSISPDDSAIDHDCELIIVASWTIWSPQHHDLNNSRANRRNERARFQAEASLIKVRTCGPKDDAVNKTLSAPKRPRGAGDDVLTVGVYRRANCELRSAQRHARQSIQGHGRHSLTSRDSERRYREPS